MPDRRVWRVTGDHAIGFLNATTSQELLILEPGRGALACVLDEKAHVLAEVRVFAIQGGDVLLEGEAASEHGIAWLARVAPLSGCSVVEEEWALTAVRGEDLGAPPTEHDFVERDGALFVRVAWRWPGVDVISRNLVDIGAIDEADAFDVARIVAGVPRFGVDITTETRINETPLVQRAVSATKGCYPGQESVARVQNLGRVKRRLVGLRTPAATLEAPDGVILTSVAPMSDGTAALGFARADLADGTTIDIAGAPVTIFDLT